MSTKQKQTISLDLHAETIAVLQTSDASAPQAGCTCCSMSSLTLCCSSNGSPPTCCY